MTHYCSSLFIYYFLLIVNFCETTYNNIVTILSKSINKQLEGRVLYYGMYSKGENDLYYTQLYDYTSLIQRLKLIFLSIVYRNYFERISVFTYNEVQQNLENLTSFMIHAVIVSHIKNGMLITEILSYKEASSLQNENKQKVKFVYAIVITKQNTEYDFTKELNIHINDVRNSPLDVEDFVYIINNKYSKNVFDNKDVKLKVMMDNDFNEVVFNSNDKIIV